MRDPIRCYRRGNGGPGAYLATALKVEVAPPGMSAFPVVVDVVNRNRGYSGDIVRLLLTSENIRDLVAALADAERRAAVLDSRGNETVREAIEADGGRVVYDPHGIGNAKNTPESLGDAITAAVAALKAGAR